MANAQLDMQAERAAQRPGRVLVVDDQPELRRLFRRTLVRAGHDVVEALDCRAAIALAEAGTFDVVISDVRMPDMSGLELLRALCALDPDLPVVLVSGSPDLETARKAVEYGVLDYLMKPVTFEDLRASAARGVELHRRRVAAREAADDRRSAERLRVSPACAPETWDGWTVL